MKKRRKINKANACWGTKKKKRIKIKKEIASEERGEERTRCT